MDIPNTLDLMDFSVFKKPSSHHISRWNDQKGLEAIHKFGWLRALEIGNVLWQTQPNRQGSGARIARRWLKNKWVMQRTLPYGHGPAFLLTQKGADFLGNEFDIEAYSGKKIGDNIDQIGDSWRPTNSWQHDLLANSFLTLCMGGGAKVFSERELKRMHPYAKKIPDGLFMMSRDWWAIEIERADKWSEDLRGLTKSLIEANVHGLALGERVIKQVCLVYQDPNIETTDDRRYLHDHFGRVKRAAGGIIKKGGEFDLVALPVRCRGGAVLEITTPLVEVVTASMQAHYRKSVVGQKWTQDDSGKAWVEFRPNRPFEIEIIPAENKNKWRVKIQFDDPLVIDLDDPSLEKIKRLVNVEIEAHTILAAREKAQNLLLAQHHYEEWFRNFWFAKEIAAEAAEAAAERASIDEQKQIYLAQKAAEEKARDDLLAQEERAKEAAPVKKKNGGLFGFLR